MINGTIQSVPAIMTRSYIVNTWKTEKNILRKKLKSREKIPPSNIKRKNTIKE